MVKLTLLLADLGDFVLVNEIRADLTRRCFRRAPPISRGAAEGARI
ncbi:MAG: hypothetical protein IPI27_05630 [Betaproteobacteria bacterium]|nr:hypothetical protein [Betaproteobacteria bacterium]